MAARLPVPGQDNGTWGDLLNDFLRQAHDDDGSLKPLTQSQVTGLVQALADKAAQTDLDTLTTAVADKVDITDSRLSDARTPLDGSVTDAKVSSSAAISADKLADGTNNKVMTAAERALLGGATAGATANALVQRDANGNSVFWKIFANAASPSTPNELTRKDYVDAGDVFASAHPQAMWNSANTLNTANGQWWKVATATISAQYGETIQSLLFVGSNYGLGNLQQSRVSWRVKQQAAMGSAPSIQVIVSDIRQDGNVTFDQTSFKAITETNTAGSTVVSLWVQINETFTVVYAYEEISRPGGTASVSYAASLAAGVATGSLPAGTSTAGTLAPNDADFANATSTGTALTLVRRDPSGNASFNRAYAAQSIPVMTSELTRKDYVDAFGSLAPASASTPGATITPTTSWLPSTQVITLTANTTIGALPTTGGQLTGRSGTITLNLIQATGSGPFTITWPSGIKWAQGAAAPAMPTTAGARLIVNLYWDGLNQWCGMVSGTF